MKRNLITLLVAASCAASSFAYFEDFEGPVGSEWSHTTTSTTPLLGRNFLGEFDNQTVTLTLSTIAGNSYKLCFDLYIIESWDGNNTSVGPDNWKLDIDGSNVLLDTTFSNLDEVSGTAYNQAYSAANPNGSFAPYTDADEVDNLGYTFYGSSVYKFGGPTNSSFSFVATGSTTLINFTAYGLQGIGDESWGLDNVKVVPEPATMSILGLGIAALLRKKKHKA